MKKFVSFFLAAVLLAGFLLPASAAGAGFGGLLDSVKQTYQPQETRVLESMDPDEILREASRGKPLTLMVYMCGSNLESMPQSSASRDIEEMMDSGYSAEDVNLLLMPGGAKRWHIANINGQETGIYCVRPDGITRLWESDRQMNMGDPDTLSFFLRYGYENFPAQKYALILWDHGGGAIGGICSDENSRDSLSLSELRAAMEKSPVGREKLEWIGFDACLMASAEVAFLLSPFAGYMVASEETEPGYGWDYHFLKEIADDPSGAETGTRIVDSYLAWYEEHAPGCDVTLSCVDLSAVDALAEQIDRFFGQASAHMDSGDGSELSKAVRRAVFFGNVDEYASEDSAANARVYDLADLGSLVECLDSFGSPDGKALTDYLCGRVVVKADNNLEEALSGLTLYHPLRAKNQYYANLKTYRELSVFPAYAAYIEKFGSMLLKEPAADFSGLLSTLAGGSKVKRALIRLTLNEEQLRNLARAELIVLQRGEGSEESYHLVSANNSVHVSEQGVLEGELIQRNLFLTDKRGEPLDGVPPLSFSLNGSGQYLLPVVIRSTDPDSGEELRSRACLVCEEQEGESALRVVSVLAYDELTDSYTPRLSLDLALADAIDFEFVDRRPTRGGSGALLGFDAWEISAVKRFSWNAAEEYQLRFLENRLDENSVSVAFHLTDTQSNHYLSELIGLRAPGDEDAQTLIYDDRDRLVTLREPHCEVQDGAALLFTVEVTNIAEEELLVTLSGLTVNGVPIDAEASVYGMGPHYGLLSGEEQLLMLMVRDPALENMTAIETLGFELLVRYAQNGEPAAAIPVSGTMHLAIS